jgi:hypothetical protein
MVRFASFNVFGIGSRDVLGAVRFAQQHFSPGDPLAGAIGFQECWTGEQRTRILDGYVGAAAAPKNYANVQIWRDGDARWRCVVPRTPPVVGLALSSGLALCVSGTVRDAFFVRYRGGAIPDSLAQKGVLAVLFEQRGQPRRAVINTHMHDYSNDRFGQHRYAWLDTLVSCVHWIDKHWRVPTLVLGDFNIDSMTAYTRTSEPDFRCYSRLIRIGTPAGQTWYDVNARVNQGRPVKTNNTRSIDHHLLKGERATGATFQSLETPESDHRLTLSQWGA